MTKLSAYSCQNEALPNRLLIVAKPIWHELVWLDESLVEPPYLVLFGGEDPKWNTLPGQLFRVWISDCVRRCHEIHGLVKSSSEPTASGTLKVCSGSAPVAAAWANSPPKSYRPEGGLMSMIAEHRSMLLFSAIGDWCYHLLRVTLKWLEFRVCIDDVGMVQKCLRIVARPRIGEIVCVWLPVEMWRNCLRTVARLKWLLIVARPRIDEIVCSGCPTGMLENCLLAIAWLRWFENDCV